MLSSPTFNQTVHKGTVSHNVKCLTHFQCELSLVTRLPKVHIYIQLNIQIK